MRDVLTKMCVTEIPENMSAVKVLADDGQFQSELSSAGLGSRLSFILSPSKNLQIIPVCAEDVLKTSPPPFKME